MSYGSLSGPAIEALNRGAAMAGCLHNTGEGGMSDHHLHGGDLVLQVGTGYFGCRDDEGRFDLDKLVRVVESGPVKAIEFKLSQGAKPGLGGVLPAGKITEEISRIRHIPRDRDCVSPSRHTAFNSVDSMLDVLEAVAQRTGLPVGIKSAVGDLTFWQHLAEQMADGSRGVDFITVDGGEGGTGAAPQVFADSVALPYRSAFPRVYRIFADTGITDRIVFIGSGKLGLPETAMVAFALGADMLNIAREAMIAVGCLQTQKCHTGHCPTGVATQNPWLTRARAGGQGTPLRLLRPHPATRSSQGGRGSRPRAPGAHLDEGHRDPLRPRQCPAAAQGLALRPVVGTAGRRRPRGDRGDHGEAARTRGQPGA